MRFATVLVLSGDADARAALDRYAHGKFSREELAINARDGLTPARMQRQARLLEGDIADPLGLTWSRRWGMADPTGP